MKNLLSTIISLTIGAAVGSTTTYYLTSNKVLPDSAPNPVFQQINNNTGGTDKYEIRWYGKPTKDYFLGNYTIVEKDKPIRIEPISKTPHIVKLILPKGSGVAATGNCTDIKIFRNGKECVKTAVVGTGMVANKACL
ncbi:MAG: hypothetical protein HGA42_05500 [Nostocales cyanobacterium W4_Combined_metabat2_030]|nr:hypothetical protein [Nostocales cyanobacterium W4_Combined_metabat2_030]